ncbi:putative DNA-directed RNA polymerase subunit [Trypanosoma grayi]|uniref:putative DNA-directed RNA polymerase subunit n=1 Tax=Trypanosoma grayi TaxID=71804 RepID=UPI0004F47DC4|nr:putative DNA-directed RNA polymerase subunit [Trypanosoma grayi]KEG13404.1 putative DNA-directed RNA polymerase subunit [Trypanosoma grayi]
MIHSEIVGNEEVASTADCPRVTPVQERRSGAYLTKYEIARILGERARQIVNGTSMLLHSRSNATERSALELAERCADPYSLSVDPVFIAKVDLLQGRIPMIVRRTWPDGWTENIPVSELLVDKAMLNMQN